MELDLTTLSDEAFVALNLAVAAEATRRFADTAVATPAPAPISPKVTLPDPSGTATARK
jgi:hypothetical protein